MLHVQCFHSTEEDTEKKPWTLTSLNQKGDSEVHDSKWEKLLWIWVKIDFAYIFPFYLCTGVVHDRSICLEKSRKTVSSV